MTATVEVLFITNYSEHISYLDVLGEGFIELFVIVLVLCQFSKQLKTLLDNVFANDLQDFALLQHLSRDVERQVLGVHDTTDEV